MGIVFGLLTSLAIGSADLFGRRVSNARGPIVAGVVLQFVATFTSLAALGVVGSAYDTRDLGLGLVSGLGLGVGLWGYFSGLQRASSAVVAPLVATLSAVIPYGYALIRGSEPSVQAVVGAVVAFVGIIVITAGRGRVTNLAAGLRWGLLSGLGYGVGLSVVIDADEASGAWPAVGQRIGAFCLMLVVAATMRLSPLPPRGLRLAALLAGIFAGSSTVFYLLGVQADAPSAVVTASLFPAMSVVVGRVAYDDEVGRRQVVGIAIAIVGVIVLALG